MIKRDSATELDASVQAKLLRQPCQINRLAAPAAVKVELGIRHFRSDLRKSLNRNIQSLVPLKSAREKNDELIVAARPLPLVENRRVHMVEKNRAFLF